MYKNVYFSWNVSNSTIFLHLADQANPTQVEIANEGPPSCLGVEKAQQISPNAAQAALLQQPVEDVHSKNEVTILRKSLTLCCHLAEALSISPSIKGS